MSVQELQTRRATEPHEREDVAGIFPAQELRHAVENGWISSGEYRIPGRNIQPASVDLRLGDFAWALRCSFLPDARSTVMDRVAHLAQDKIDIRSGATLERDRPYLIPLVEEVRLPPDVHAKTNPKSSTGRLDVFTRVITERNSRFDEVAAGYSGKLYLEVVPRSFAVRVTELMSLNQLRLAVGEPLVRDADLPGVHDKSPLLYMESEPLPREKLAIADGLFLSIDLSGPPDTPVGFRAKEHSHRIDMSKIGHYSWRDYWEPVYPERRGGIVLPQRFSTCSSRQRGSASHPIMRPR